MNERELREQICEVGRRIYARNMAASNDGNISVKLNDKEWLCTPTLMSKGYMTPDCICKVDAGGNVIEGNYRPSSEMKMHMRVYQKRGDVGCVVHAHPSHATAFAIAGIPLNQPIMPEAVIYMGCVPIVEYGAPTTADLAENLDKYLDHYDAVLLESHGALTWGKDLLTAYHLMESLEFYAELLYKAKLLGGARELTSGQIEKLYEVRRNYGLTGKHPADICRDRSGPACHKCERVK